MDRRQWSALIRQGHAAATRALDALRTSRAAPARARSG